MLTRLASILSVSLLLAETLPAQPLDRTWQFGGRAGASWEASSGLNILVDAEAAPGSLQPLELRPDVNIAPLVFSRHPYAYYAEPFDPLWEDGMPRIFRGPGNHHGPGEVTPFSSRVDGDMNTFVAFRRYRKMHGEFYTLDFGGPLPLERFVVQMPSPELVDLTGEPLVNYVAENGELSASLTGPTILRDLREGSADYRPMDKVLGRIDQNLVAPIVIDFARAYYRYLRWRVFPDWISERGYHTVEKYGYAEFEVFGRGFAAESRLRTKVVDLGRPAMVGKVHLGVSRWRRVGARWVDVADPEGDGPDRVWDGGVLEETSQADARVSARLKTGTTPESLRYFTWNDFSGLEAIDRDAWVALEARQQHDPEFVGFRGPVADDRDNWTPWSGPVRESGARVALTGGRYLQVQVAFESAKPTDVARLDSLSIELIPLLSPTLVAEVGTLEDPESGALAEIPLGVPAELIYAIRADFNGERSQGFEAVRITTPSTPEFVQLAMGSPQEETAVAPEEVRVDTDGLTLFLPHAVDRDQRLLIRLRTSLYTLSEKLVGEVFNRDNTELRQRIDEGDATDLIGTNQLVVVARDAISVVFGDLQISPRVFSPNGDGRNDRARVSYSLFGVTDGVVEVAFYNLSGEAVRRISVAGQRAGLNSPVEWDGRDEGGATVPPGLYLCQVETNTSRGRSSRAAAIAVAY